MGLRSPRIRALVLVIAGLTAGAVVSNPAAGAEIIAATGQTVDGHVLTDFFPFPDINNAGTVAYVGLAGSASSGIFTQAGRLVGTGDVIDGVTVANLQGIHPSLNNHGTVAFCFRDAALRSYYATQNDILFDITNGRINGDPLISLGSISLGDNNHVAFGSARNTGSGVVQGIYSPTAVLFEAGGTVDGLTVTGMNGVFNDSINDDGTIVFRGQHSGSTTSQFTQSDELFREGQAVAGRTLPTINPDAPINNAGQIAFQGFYGGGSGIYTLTRRVAETGDVIDGRTLQNFQSNVSISESGLVAYEASFAGGGSGLFVEQDLLVATGDVLGGKTIASVEPPQVNDAGTIVAMVTFTDGTEAIVTATVPEPAAVTLLVALACPLLCRRRGARC